MIPWPRYLLATYLVPGAAAEGKAGFEELTCDHVVNGMVVGSRRDNRELYAITVEEPLTAYDGWYVALAESFDAPLATLDRRLAGAPGPRCAFRLPG